LSRDILLSGIAKEYEPIWTSFPLGEKVVREKEYLSAIARAQIDAKEGRCE
jgi:hypothetical protein